jgi:hypothetical protein
MKKEQKPWALVDAHWWQFWMPQSGLIGGLINGAVIVAATFAIFWVFK